MVKHIVMWTLHDKSKASHIKARLEALQATVPSIIQLEVGIDDSNTPASADIVLNSTFADHDALQAYVDHPDHQAVIPMMQEMTSSRRVVDYEI